MYKRKMKSDKPKHYTPKSPWWYGLRPLDWAMLALAIVIITFLACMTIRLIVVSEERHPSSTESEQQTSVEPNEEKWVYVPEPIVEAEIPPRTYIGNCRLTVYTPTESHWGYATATGATSAHLMTCAVDPKVIPYGSNVIVIDKDGYEWRFRAVDCGNFSGDWVDIFFDGTLRHGIEWLDEVFNGDFAEVWIEEVDKW